MNLFRRRPDPRDELIAHLREEKARLEARVRDLERTFLAVHQPAAHAVLHPPPPAPPAPPPKNPLPSPRHLRNRVGGGFKVGTTNEQVEAAFRGELAIRDLLQSHPAPEIAEVVAEAGEEGGPSTTLDDLEREAEPA